MGIFKRMFAKLMDLAKRIFAKLTRRPVRAAKVAKAEPYEAPQRLTFPRDPSGRIVVHMISSREYKRRKTRRLMAKESRRRNRT